MVGAVEEDGAESDLREWKMSKQKKPRGRPPKYPMPEPLDTDMDTLAEVVLKAKPKDVWRYEQETGQSKLSASKAVRPLSFSYRPA